jgi:hypothetical protein
MSYGLFPSHCGEEILLDPLLELLDLASAGAADIMIVVGHIHFYLLPLQM